MADDCLHDGPVIHKFDGGKCPILCKRCMKIIGWWSIVDGGYNHHFHQGWHETAHAKFVPELHIKDDPHGYALYTPDKGITEVFENVKELLDYVHDRGRPGVDLIVDWPDSFSGIYDEDEDEDEGEW